MSDNAMPTGIWKGTTTANVYTTGIDLTKLADTCGITLHVERDCNTIMIDTTQPIIIELYRTRGIRGWLAERLLKVAIRLGRIDYNDVKNVKGEG